MKTHTNEFKNKIKEFGRELDSKITYTVGGVTTELGNEELNSVTPHYEGSILKSVMKQLDIDSNVEIPVGTALNYKFGIKTRNAVVLDYRDNYDYVDYGNYIVKDVEKQEDTRSYKITCYDKMLNSMKSYEKPKQLTTDATFLADKEYYEKVNGDYNLYTGSTSGNPSTLGLYEIVAISYPITIRDYIILLCNHLDITFKNATDTFANYNKTIPNELYLDENGNTLNYTFRDVFDELAEVTASTICIDENDKLEIRYITDARGGVNLLNNVAVGKTQNDVTFTINADKSVTIKSTTGATANTFLRLEENFTLPVGRYYLKGGYASSSTYLAIQVRHSDNTYTSTSVGSIGYHSFDIVEGDYIPFVQIRVGSGWTGEYTFYPAIVLDSSTPYEEYIDTIDEEYLKDVNVNFGEKFGPVNTIVLSRGGDGDKITLSQPSNLADEDKIAIQITDNQIMNGNDRDTFMSDILNKLYGLEYYINDYSSTGICYLDLCDRYKIKIGGVSYNCIMFNDEVNITQGLQEQVYTNMQEQNEQEYKYMSSTDRGITQANIIAKKNEGEILEITQGIIGGENGLEQRLSTVEVKQTTDERTISIISTNIDDETGEVNAVTTREKKFTFNDEGLNISSSDNTFKSTIDEEGLFFYNGETKIAEYTKDGSKQKDLQLFGVYYYGMDDEDDTPMFVAQLYTDNNGESAFGHFYNRGD